MEKGTLLPLTAYSSDTLGEEFLRPLSLIISHNTTQHNKIRKEIKSKNEVFT